MKTILHSLISGPAFLFIPQLPYNFCESLLQKFLVTIRQEHFLYREPFIADVECIPIKMRTINR